MRKLWIFTGYCLAVGLTAGCSASASETEKTYSEMTNSEQVVVIERLVLAMNELAHDTTNRPGAREKVFYKADVDLDMIYAIRTYQQHVPSKNLYHAKAAIQKVKESERLCDRAEVIHLRKQGLGFRTIMNDLSGQRLYESDTCPPLLSTPVFEPLPVVGLRGKSKV